MIRIGARGSKLSRAQVKIVQDLLKSKLNLDSKFIPITSLGDLNTSIPIKKVAREGVFTSTIEQALVKNEIDIAVHSYKDLPIINLKELEVVAVLKRHNPSDSLIILDSKVEIDEKNYLKVKKGTRIGTGSARRQSQLLNKYPDISTIDLRGNVDTRLNKLIMGQYDGVIMATSVFERIELNVPEKFTRIELDLSLFPTAPAQGAICIQMKISNEFSDQIIKLNHPISKLAVETERKILKSIGSGCQLPMGVYIYTKGNNWNINLTLAPLDWLQYSSAPLSRIQFKSKSINQLYDKAISFLPEHPNLGQLNLIDKEVILIGTKDTIKKYHEYLINLNAQVRCLDLQEITDIFTDNQINNYSERWLTSDWVIITSKNSLNSLNRFNSLFPKQNLKCASVGSSTTKLLQKFGYAVHFQAENQSAKSLADGLIRITNSEKIFYISSKSSNKDFLKSFTDEGYKVSIFEGYESKMVQNPPILSIFQVDYVIVFSPNYASLAFEIYGNQLAKKWVAIGNSTELRLKELGLRNILKPKFISLKEVAEVLQ